MIALVLINYDVNDPSTCDNVGPCCYSCPVFDSCDQHYEEDEA